MVKTITIYRALEPFLTKPMEKLHLAHLSRELKQPHPTLRQWLNELEKEGVLRKRRQGRLSLYSLNLENPIITDYLVIAEKNKLIRYCKNSVALAELASYVHSKLSSNCIIFGSAAENFRNAGDVDLLIVGNDETKLLKDFAARLNKKLHIIGVSSMYKISKSLQAEITKKHLLISGSESFVRWIVWQQ